VISNTRIFNRGWLFPAISLDPLDINGTISRLYLLKTSYAKIRVSFTHVSFSIIDASELYTRCDLYKKNILHLYKRIRLDRAEYDNISTESH